MMFRFDRYAEDYDLNAPVKAEQCLPQPHSGWHGAVKRHCSKPDWDPRLHSVVG